MTAAKQIALISEEEYLARELDGDIRHEYLGGYVYAMAGAKTSHNRVATAWVGILHAQLSRKKCELFNSDMKVRVRFPTHTRFYYPDGMVVCEPSDEEQAFQSSPVIIAEVISESTRRTDEGEKRDAYLSISSLMVYMIIETREPRIIVHRRSQSGFVTEVFEGIDAVVPLDEVHARLALSELYERVDFDQAAAEAETELRVLGLLD